MTKEAVKTRTNTQLEYPPRYNVIIYNDDYTPMEFVIKLLIEVFIFDFKSIPGVPRPF